MTYLFEEHTDLWERYSSSIPVDVVRVAMDNNINLSPKIMNNDSGRIFKNNNGNYTIEFNIFHASTRQRFTVAHELGALFPA